MKKLTIAQMEQPEWDLIGGGISTYNEQLAGPENGHNICFVLKSEEGANVGGVIAAVHWGWLYINLMWIQEEFRGQGYGSLLMQKAEEEAIQHGAKHAYLDTFTFQAPGFYKKLGYTVFGELPDFPDGQTRYYMKKDL